MRTKPYKKLAASGALALTACLAAQAGAVTFPLTVDATIGITIPVGDPIIEPTAGAVNLGDLNLDGDDEYTAAQWEVGDPTMSMLSISTVPGGVAFADPVVDGASAWMDIATFTQDNTEDIDFIASWASTIVASITFSQLPTVPPINPVVLETPVVFNETNNNALPCSEAPAGGPTNPLNSECDDFYVIDDTALDQVVMFEMGNKWFSIQQRLDAGANGFVVGCGADTCVYSAEDAVSEINLQVRLIQETHVPEPGTLALFGLGLAGLGFAARRRMQR